MNRRKTRFRPGIPGPSTAYKTFTIAFRHLAIPIVYIPFYKHMPRRKWQSRAFGGSRKYLINAVVHSKPGVLQRRLHFSITARWNQTNLSERQICILLTHIYYILMYLNACSCVKEWIDLIDERCRKFGVPQMETHLPLLAVRSGSSRATLRCRRRRRSLVNVHDVLHPLPFRPFLL